MSCVHLAFRNDEKNRTAERGAAKLKSAAKTKNAPIVSAGFIGRSGWKTQPIATMMNPKTTVENKASGTAFNRSESDPRNHVSGFMRM